jgi:protein-S-isoprenylcysteine O-methyltransferase Ste14
MGLLGTGHLTGTEVAREKWGSRWFIALAYAVFFSGLVVSASDSATRNGKFTLTAVGALGVTFLIVGLSIYFASRLILGRSFSETVRVRPEQKLVTKGPYRFIRHPIYLGEILYFLSIPLILGSLYGFIIMLILIPMLLRRIEYEEKVLSAKFGPEYEEYAHRTRKLVPFIY